MICDVITNSDITVQQVHKSEDMHDKHIKSLAPIKRILDALTASKIDKTLLPKKSRLEFVHRFGDYSKNKDEPFTNIRHRVNELAKQYHFFNWETEMMDAFTDSRRGFDLIVGNPPWNKMKPYDDEFFAHHHIGFKSLTPKTEKKKIMAKILKDTQIKKAYEEYIQQYQDKNKIYGTYSLQGLGDNDLWKLILERTLNLVAKNGIISMVIPSQLLSIPGTRYLRRDILGKKILSLYVFENREKIFPIDSRYRFVLLCVQNNIGPDKFPAGFYLHHLTTLNDQTKEKEKFGTLSKSKILESPSGECIIPEASGKELELFEKISQNNSFESGIRDGWSMNMSSGFHKTNNSDLFQKDRKGWPIYEGKHMHQYNHKWSNPQFSANSKNGLDRESRRRVFDGRHVDVHNSFRLVFRDITRSTDTRTTISTVIPPHTFHSQSLRSLILLHNDQIILNRDYDKKILYLCGILNSMTFDFVSRMVIQINLATVIKSLTIPNPDHEDRIAELAAMLLVGTPEFEGLSESIRIKNITLSPSQRIEIAAELDALVAYSYNLTVDEYKIIINSFKLFKKNPTLYNLEEITWNNKNLKEFYGEMAELALQYFEEITE